jgi:3-deoxy-D-manno-octulosonic acid (KDO) 8-phosphate synthase
MAVAKAGRPIKHNDGQFLALPWDIKNAEVHVKIEDGRARGEVLAQAQLPSTTRNLQNTVRPRP